MPCICCEKEPMPGPASFDDTKVSVWVLAGRNRPVANHDSNSPLKKESFRGGAGVGAESSERSPQCCTVWGLPPVDPSHPHKVYQRAANRRRLPARKPRLAPPRCTTQVFVLKGHLKIARQFTAGKSLPNSRKVLKGRLKRM